MSNLLHIKKLGTFGGVFTPSILTILGVILFLRSGYIVGNGGIFETLIIITLANLISFFTTYSLVTIVTNMRIKEGGPYYIISRTLGPEWGGVIGIILFFAISVSVGFYCIGAAEVIAVILPSFGEHNVQLMAAFIAIVLFAIAWMGTDFTTKLQYLVMAVLFIALFSFFLGAFMKANLSQLIASWQPSANSPGFWYLFAIFFPAITGFTQGINMSGDLENPQRSIIRGTIWAVGLSFIIYLASALMLAAAYPQKILQDDMHAFEHVAWIPWLVIVGTFAAAVSSALASFLGAPRVLSAMGKDELIPMIGFFAEKSNGSPNPRKALVFSGIIVAFTVSMGDLNLVASVVTVFFLLSYGLLNYATFYEAQAQSPSFRPKLRSYNKWISLCGVMVCLGAIIAINPVAGVISAFITSLIYQFLKYKVAGNAAWSDSTRSFKIKRVRDLLLQIEQKKEYPRDWRPSLLAFLPDQYANWEEIIYFSSLIGGESDTLSAVHFYERNLTSTQKEEKEQIIKNSINATKTDAFALVLSGISFKTGLSTLLQSYGLGPIKVNTVIFGWQEQRTNTAKRNAYVERVQTVLRLGINLIIVKTDKKLWRPIIKGDILPKRIDIWWGENKTGQLMLLMAFLTTQSPRWNNVSIRILAQGNKKSKTKTLLDLKEMLEDVRIDADIKLFHEINQEVIFKHSSDASIVFMPMKLFGTMNEGYVGDLLDDSRFDSINFALFIAKEDIQLDADPDIIEENEVEET